jgi:hypothetical protein
VQGGGEKVENRSRNWHHPFPVARFQNKLPIAVHNAYNRLFFGHRTAWEAARFLRTLADPSGIIPDEALSDEAMARLRRRADSYARVAGKRTKRRKNGSGRPEPSCPYREAFELLFGQERRLERCIAILNQPPWMPPGVTFRWEGETAVIVFDYAAMRSAAKKRRDVRGLLPEFE